MAIKIIRLDLVLSVLVEYNKTQVTYMRIGTRPDPNNNMQIIVVYPEFQKTWKMQVLCAVHN